MRIAIDWERQIQRTIVRFINPKFCYEALDKKSNLRKVDNTKLSFQAGAALYFSENMTPYNQHLAWKCGNLKRAKGQRDCEVEVHHESTYYLNNA